MIVRIQLHSARCYPSTQSIPIWNIPNIDKSAFVIPVGTDIALNVENTISVGRGAGKPSVWPGTVFPCQGFNSVRDILSVFSLLSSEIYA